ncbi:MAG: DUF4186 family protein [Bacteriovoracia bacterium]
MDFAKATCCRGCLQKWHKIEKGKQLSEQEIDYVISFVMKWIEDQIIQTPAIKPQNKYQQLSLF